MVRVLLMIVSVLLILITLMQRGEASGLLKNNNISLFKENKAGKPERILFISTAVLIAVYFILVFIVAFGGK